MAGRLLIKDGVTVAGGVLARQDVLCDGPRIVAIGHGIEAPGATIFDAAGLTLDILAALAPVIGSSGGAEPLGCHLEGPFINPLRKGAFPPEYLRAPVREEFVRYQAAAGGLIRQVTLAPELPLALELVSAVAVSGALPAMGHTDANTEQAHAGFETGVRHVTHLFNAMRPLHQREGGPIAAALLQESVTCELICDGSHVALEPLRLAYRVLGPARTVVVTDNLHIAGTARTGSEFAGQIVFFLWASSDSDYL